MLWSHSSIWVGQQHKISLNDAHWVIEFSIWVFFSTVLAVFVLLEKNCLYKGCKVNITLAQEVITSLTYEMKKGKKPQTFIALSSSQTMCLANYIFWGEASQGTQGFDAQSVFPGNLLVFMPFGDICNGDVQHKQLWKPDLLI